jgi:excisionase family DNA binding protein
MDHTIIRYVALALIAAAAVITAAARSLPRQRERSRRWPQVNAVLTIEDVADLCAVHPRTVRQWIAAGLPVVRIEKVVRVRARDLDWFIEQHVEIEK